MSSSNGHLATSATGRYLTTCRLCLKRIAETDPLEIPIIGEPGAKAEALVAGLVRHLLSKHRQEFQEGSALAKEIPAFFILAAFDSQDPSLNERLELIRSGLFAAVRKNTFPDSSLESLTASLGLDPEDAAKVLEGFKAVRDACCEFGQFAPKTPPAVKSLLFTA